MVQTINWYEKDSDEIYDHFNSLRWEDAYLFLSDMLKNNPDAPIFWIDLLADLEEYMLGNGMAKEVIEFIDLYRITFPGAYENEYQYIELELIPHLFYLEDIDTLKKRIEILKCNPVEGIDTVSKELLFKLIYHGFSDLAVEYSQVVWKPLSEAEDLIGHPENDFCISIYLNELENRYHSIQKGETINAELLRKEMEVYGFDDDIEVFQDVISRLSEDINMSKTMHADFSNIKDYLLFLNIQFVKYMKDEYNLPFILSDRFFNLLQKPELFGRVDTEKGFLYIPYPVLSEHYDRQYDNIFHMNLVEIFGKVFGLKYVYHFFHVHNFIDDNFYKKMSENIHFLEYEFMVNSRESLWQMMFVFDWPRLFAKDIYRMQIFSDTYRYNIDEKVAENLKNYLKIFIVPERIQSEIDIHNNLKKESGLDYVPENDVESDYGFPDPELPIVNPGPKIGRNDPCPCGSGKKYKKCCLDKPVNQ